MLHNTLVLTDGRHRGPRLTHCESAMRRCCQFTASIDTDTYEVEHAEQNSPARPHRFRCLQALGSEAVLAANWHQSPKLAESPTIAAANQGVKLPGLDSNQEWRNQNPQCYHYTTGHYCCLIACISQRANYGKSAATSHRILGLRVIPPRNSGFALHLQAFGHRKGDLL